MRSRARTPSGAHSTGLTADQVDRPSIELVNRRLDPIVEALETDADPAERLFDTLATIRTTFAVGREDLKAYADAVAASSSNAELARSIGDIHDRLRGYLSGLIAEMPHDGYVQRWVEPDSMAALLIAIGDSLATQAHFGEPDVDGVLDQAALLLLSARPEEPRLADRCPTHDPPNGSTLRISSLGRIAVAAVHGDAGTPRSRRYASPARES